MTRRQLSKLYDNNHAEFSKLVAFNAAEGQSINWAIHSWQHNHYDKVNMCNYTTEQYNRALKHIVLDIACYKLGINL